MSRDGHPNRKVQRAFEQMQATNHEAVQLRRAGRDAAALNAAERAVRECEALCSMDPMYQLSLITVLLNAASLARLNEDVLSWFHYAARGMTTAYAIQDSTGRAPAEAERAVTDFEATTFALSFGRDTDLLRESLTAVRDGTSAERRAVVLETVELTLRIGDRHRRAGAAEVAIGHYNAATVLSEACHTLGPAFVAADCAAWMSLAEARVMTTEYRQGGRESASRACSRALNSLNDFFRTEEVGIIMTLVDELPAAAELKRRCALAGEMLLRYSGVLDALGHEAESIGMEVSGRQFLEPLGRVERLDVDIRREMAVEKFNEVERGFTETP